MAKNQSSTFPVPYVIQAQRPGELAILASHLLSAAASPRLPIKPPTPAEMRTVVALLQKMVDEFYPPEGGRITELDRAKAHIVELKDEIVWYRERLRDYERNEDAHNAEYNTLKAERDELKERLGNALRTLAKGGAA
ncbi:hypothetical protein GJ688_01905 [Heliobacillus mobilis]|uniref:Uncharacterized protein n=1 Tax=Heliobacterium mobile TaxID=28064 RepID=A0A6I3SFM4_HELMO|nr:hypothetical protein [Heliobacterium mobile]MTV47736.1 hypothetical protein [Heliobacterium mobile]